MRRYSHYLPLEDQKKLAQPYFSAFILVLGLIVIAIIIIFLVVYQKQIFQDFQQGPDQSTPTFPVGPIWPNPVNLNQHNVYDYCQQKKKQQKQHNKLIQQQILSDSANSLEANS